MQRWLTRPVVQELLEEVLESGIIDALQEPCARVLLRHGAELDF